MIHELKIRPNFFRDIISGVKTFEIRRNDRDYKVGDILILQEYEVLKRCYSGRETKRLVTHVTSYAQAEGFVVMSIKDIAEQNCEECAEGETNCNNCANLGEVSICANGILWIDDCLFYKPKNYCGNCGRKLVE